MSWLLSDSTSPLTAYSICLLAGWFYAFVLWK
jgi:hypothetical protein